MSIFYKGMDLSFLPQGVEEGMKIKDFDGTEAEPLGLMKKYGVNAVRLRLWNEPERVAEAKGYCNLAHTLKLAKQVKQQDMNFMLDFHYSDFWADPGNQTKPAAWEELHGKELVDAVYTYTKDTLLYLKKEGVLPDIVQIGNEIRSGLLFPDGELPDVEGMTALINAGIRGARDVADKEQMRVMIHLDQGGRYRFLKDWFDNAIAAGMLDFDLIGLSYYPFWHGTFNDLKETAEQLVKDFKKPIMVVETAHAWRKSKKGFIDDAQERIAGIAATPEGQKQVIDMVMNIVASLPDDMGQGVYYWEPLCIPDGGGGWNESMGILTEDGTVMDAVRSFSFTKEKACFQKVAKVYEPKEMVCLLGEEPVLPEKLKILYYDGRTEKRPVQWQTPEKNWYKNTGDFLLEGTVEGGLRSTVTVKITDVIEEKENLVHNPKWKDGFAEWEITKSGDEVELSVENGALIVNSPMNFRCTAAQTIEITEPGVYRMKVSYRGVDTTNVDVRMFMETDKQYQDNIIHPTDEEWVEHELENVKCEKGRLTFGIKIVSPPIFGKICNICIEKM